MRTSFPEQVQFKAPAGFTSAVAAVARREHTSVAEVLRRGMLAHLRQVGELVVPPAPLDLSESPEQQRKAG
jgi:hypothetical protein